VIPRPVDLVITTWQARLHGRVFPVATGRGGVGRKLREGDGMSPTGAFRITRVFFRPDRLRPGLAAEVPRLGDFWCDDPALPDYNRLVRGQKGYQAERLRRADPLSDLVAVLDYNMNPVEAGKGSAIFLHVWRRPRYPTAGCAAFRRDHLIWILARLGPKSRVIIR
jgi:L,D-peptidoglycan transpeptidase YkuD (ErfK/YbiS/YcfS/YnhG family)